MSSYALPQDKQNTCFSHLAGAAKEGERINVQGRRETESLDNCLPKSWGLGWCICISPLFL